VAVRAPARAAPLVAIVERLGVPVTIIDLSMVEGLEVDLVVNATPVGTPSDPDHRTLPVLDDRVLVVDLLYDPPSTPLQRRARAAGSTVFGGIGLLVEQAALAFELWTGTPAPLEVMSAAALAALAVR
jgi:shikimate dehydrogenase